MMVINHLADALEKIRLVEGKYDVIRIVEPEKKRTMLVKEDRYISDGSICYSMWERGSCCQNCISSKAAAEKDIVFMSRRVNGKAYQITAVPFRVDDRSLVVELIKDITSTVYAMRSIPDIDGTMLNSGDYRLQLDLKDEVTNLFNRKFVYETLPAELLRASLNEEPLSVVMVNLDCLQPVIEEFGDNVGDRLIMEFADELKKYFAAVSRHWVARLSGEKFMICLNICDKEVAGIIANNVTTDISAKEVIINGVRIYLSCSSEVHTVCDGQSCISLDELSGIIGWFCNH